MDIEKAVVDLQKDMAAAEEQHKTLFRRIEKTEKLADSVSELALSVRDLVNAQKTTDSKVTKLCSDMDDIKQKPAKKWETVTAEFFKIVFAAAVGFLLAKLGLQ